jgi:transcription elongation GreA/GreB family factor
MAQTFDKKSLVEKIVAQLADEVESYARSARATQAEATDEQSQPEHKYDTRGLEAAYLAHGQSRQAVETEEAIEMFRTLPLRDFGPGEAIDLGALVELEGDGRRTFYFIGPRAGGTEIEYDGSMVLVITPQSPLGRQLVGAKEGASLQIEIGGVRNDYRVLSVA